MTNETGNSLFDTAGEIYFKEVEGENGYSLDVEEDIRNRLVGLVIDRFQEAQDARDTDEQRWLKAYHNFRGLYGKDHKYRGGHALISAKTLAFAMQSNPI